jgi:hypothetical protein
MESRSVPLETGVRCFFFESKKQGFVVVVEEEREKAATTPASYRVRNSNP